jgi:hypothetical protein
VKPATLFCFDADLDSVAKVVDLERDALPPVLVWEWELTAALPTRVAAASSATVGCVVSAVREALPGGGERRVTDCSGCEPQSAPDTMALLDERPPSGVG